MKNTLSLWNDTCVHLLTICLTRFYFFFLQQYRVATLILHLCLYKCLIRNVKVKNIWLDFSTSFRLLEKCNSRPQKTTQHCKNTRVFSASVMLTQQLTVQNHTVKYSMILSDIKGDLKHYNTIWCRYNAWMWKPI